jgi:hypothetical protein
VITAPSVHAFGPKGSLISAAAMTSSASGGQEPARGDMSRRPFQYQVQVPPVGAVQREAVVDRDPLPARRDGLASGPNSH